MNGMRRDELNRKVCGWMFCGGIAAVEAFTMAADSMLSTKLRGTTR